MQIWEVVEEEEDKKMTPGLDSKKVLVEGYWTEEEVNGNEGIMYT